MSNKLIGKSKQVFNTSLFYDAVRSETSPNKLSPTIASSFLDATYFNVTYDEAATENNQDKVRIAVGANFDLNDQGLQKINEAPELFYDTSLELVNCDPSDIVIVDDSNGMITQETILIKANIDEPFSDFDTQKKNRLRKNWIAYMKTGVQASSTPFEPIVKSDVVYQDLYYETSSPFTPAESLEKPTTVGKVSYTNYETYYNEAIDSLSYEDKLHTRTDINNSIPSPYGFVRIANNEVLKDGDFNLLKNMINDIYTWYNGEGVTITQTKDDVYNNLFNKYPLEALITLYGFMTKFNVDQTTGEIGFNQEIDNQILQKIVNYDSQNLNKDALFEDYIDIYTSALTDTGPAFGQAISQFDIKHRINALERGFSRLAFSPEFMKVAEKVNKYKESFPYYFKLDFTAELATEIGDLLKDLLLTRFFSRIMFLRSFTNYDEKLAQNSPTFQQSRFVHGFAGTTEAINPWDDRLINFYDYYSEKTYTNIASPEIETSENELRLPEQKQSIDALALLAKFLEADFAEHPTLNSGKYSSFLAASVSTAPNDIRNNMIFVRDDFNEPVNLDEDKNLIFQKLAGTILNAKIIEKYNQVRRSFKDIMEGTPAYTEDLFYKIVKYKKELVGGTPTFVPIQFMLFPNTSDVDVVEYVDTQLKYSKTDLEVYKYEVYSQKIVFGSKYKYLWGYDYSTESGGQAFDTNTAQTYDKLPVDSSGETLKLEDAAINEFMSVGPNLAGLSIETTDQGALFSVKVAAQVEPNIKIIEDKLFTTPDIMIMDLPPVPPHVDIIPYRAINNRLKIMLSGMSDNFREAPINILPTDQQAFEKVLAAQVSPDGLVEFGSDDPVKRFQVFRIKTEPKSYTDFELRHTVDGNVLEEKLLPNTKYWYVFRSIDIRGHFSNPSPVYQVELIDEKGAVKPNIKTFTIEPKEQRQLTRDFKKYLYIKPSLLQLYKAGDDNVDEIFSTLTKKKRYKIRLTSKSSGKKIDLNLVFNRKQETNS